MLFTNQAEAQARHNPIRENRGTHWGLGNFTLRISNFSGKLQRMYLSQHSKGSWIDAPEIEFKSGGNIPVAYASLNGHAMYAKPGLVLQGRGDVGIRNDTGKERKGV